MFLLYILLLCYLTFSRAVTIYNSAAQARLLGTTTQSATGAAASFTGAAAYNPIILDPPPVPSPPIPTQFTITLEGNAPAGVSIPQSGTFYGFSIEFSVVTQVVGKNSSLLQVPFLNLLANVQERAGGVRIRVGGNTQDYASLVNSIPNNAIFENLGDVPNPLLTTPETIFTSDMIYMLANVSALLNVQWYLGIPFNDTADLRLGIVELGQSILADNLIGLEVGNEPDLYQAHNVRPTPYTPDNYTTEFGVVVDALNSDPLTPRHNLLIGPAIAGDWTPEDVWNTGFISDYSENLAALAVEHYPTDNCFALNGQGVPHPPQVVFPDFLNHTSGQAIVSRYINSTSIAQEAGKPFLMFETNSASCGGFPGVSDSFGIALWALDYGLQMAYSNFSGANLHVSGQNVYYNPFTPPPTNQSEFHQWTVSAIYYSVLAMAETLGSSNVSRVLDLGANNENIYTPAYAIYENDAPARIALFNYVTDPSGASDYTATILVDAGGPSYVYVKYLSASSVSQKENITWAGQTFGETFGSDGRFQNSEVIETVHCTSAAAPGAGTSPGQSSCAITVPAPGFALVFLTPQALTESDPNPSSEMTFSTSTVTGKQTPSLSSLLNPSVLATSNGHSGSTWHLSSTSEDSVNSKRKSAAVPTRKTMPTMMPLFALALGVVLTT